MLGVRPRLAALPRLNLPWCFRRRLRWQRTIYQTSATLLRTCLPDLRPMVPVRVGASVPALVVEWELELDLELARVAVAVPVAAYSA